MAQKVLNATIKLMGAVDSKSISALEAKLEAIGDKCLEIGNTLGVIARPLYDFGKKTVDIYTDYQQAVNTIMGVLGKDREKELESWDEFAVKMGESTRYTALDFANAEIVAAKAGKTYEEMTDILSTSYLMAMASGNDLATSTMS